MAADHHGQLVVRQVVHAPPAIVWRAWTTAEGLATWWWASSGDTTYEVDARVGGAYRISLASAGIAVSGEYLVLDAPHRLEMSWVWEDGDGAGPVERVEVSFDGDESATSVSVRHTGPWSSPEPAANYRQGWQHVLGALATSPSVASRRTV